MNGIQPYSDDYIKKRLQFETMNDAYYNELQMKADSGEGRPGMNP